MSLNSILISPLPFGIGLCSTPRPCSEPRIVLSSGTQQGSQATVPAVRSDTWTEFCMGERLAAKALGQKEGGGLGGVE